MHTINPSLLSRLAAKRADKYRSPFATSYSSRWGGQVFNIGQNVGYRHTFGRWHESPETPFRFVGLAHSIISLRHTGWYVQHDECGETTRGVVYMLSHDRYLAAATDAWQSRDDGKGPCVFEVGKNGTPCIYSAKEDAAQAADSFAERYAESQREDDRLQGERQKAENDAEDAKTEIAELRDDARALLSEIRESRLSNALCARLTREFQAMRAKMHRAFRELQNANKRLAELPAC